MPNCKQCQTQFEIDERDAAFYKKMDVPEPTLCPECRRVRRWGFIGTSILYQRTCDLTGKPTLSFFNPKRSHKIYSNKAYWSDDWDPYEYGRDFDFNRPFFEQLNELNIDVPYQAVDIEVATTVNSDYCAMAGKLKDCYLVFHADYDERCMYTFKTNSSKDCVDCEGVNGGELCYQCTRCEDCYNCRHCFQCVNCTDVLFSYDCTSCQNCFGCFNLKNKQYYIYNEQKTKEEYEAFVSSLSLGSRESLKKLKAETAEKAKNRKVREYFGIKNEDVSGQYIYESKNTHDCFDVRGCENCRYCDHITVKPTKDTYDFHIWGDGVEMCYESAICGDGAFNLKFCANCWPSCSNLEYCISCHSTDSSFACKGLKKGQYSIFNKRYSKDEYTKLKSRIIDHMKETGEYGEFLPVSMSPLAYNESVAGFEYELLSKDEVIKRGYSWEDSLPGTFGKETLKKSDVPDDIKDVKDGLASELLACRDCGRNYKVIKQEIEFYRKQNIPVPEDCMNCRFQKHFKLRGNYTLHDCECASCTKTIKTTYSPEQPEQVLCESCYREEFN